MREEPAPGLVPLVQAVHERLRGVPLRPEPHVAFYPYTATKSTVRLRDGRVRLRLSDHLRDAPDAALRGVAGVLLSRLLGLPESRLDAGDVRAYRELVRSERMSARRRERAQAAGRKHVDPVGAHRSLLESYLRVSMDLGLVLPEAPTLSWSRTASRRRFGHHDPDHQVIVLSRVLDDPEVPEFVLDFVVYHELLHIVHPPVPGSGGRRVVHHEAFREAEDRFPRKEEAEAWLRRLAAPVTRRSPRGPRAPGRGARRP